MRLEIQKAIREGMPCLAECGGFMYLHDQMEGMDGKFYQMTGVIPGKVWRTPKLTRFGYITLTQNEPLVLGETDFGSSPAHEFHYFDSENCGTAFQAPEQKRLGLHTRIRPPAGRFSSSLLLRKPKNPTGIPKEMLRVSFVWQIQ